MAPQTKVIRRYTSIAATLDILRRKALPLLNPDFWDDRNDRYFMARYKESKKLGGLYALCAARCNETYHHWRVFTGQADGACLEIHRKPLEAALDGLPEVRYGKVDYLILDDVDTLKPADLNRLPFVKRAGFAAEEEYRIILESDEPQAAALSIEFPLELIGRIHLNPWLPKSIAQSVIETIHAIPGCEKISVHRSQLIDNARWKDAGDRVSGKPSSKAGRVLKLPPKTAQPVSKPAKPKKPVKPAKPGSSPIQSKTATKPKAAARGVKPRPKA